MKKAKQSDSSLDTSSAIGQLKTATLALLPKLEGFVLPLIVPPIDSIEEDLLFEVYGK